MLTNPILVVGGAGYIGSHMVVCLKQAGFTPIVFDNLSTGHRDAVLDAEFIQGDLADVTLLDEVFAQHHFLAVMHFASFIQVGESVQQPAKYYQNNVTNTLNLLQALLKHKVKHFIFSSTAAVYGDPQSILMDEAHPKNPVNPYGHTKRMVEIMLEDFSRSYDFHFMSLRYFNAAGADPAGRLRERHEPETHLIPLLLQAAAGQRASVTLYGKDYATPDGTCIRDYIHVMDLCEAHLLALKALLDGKKSNTYNLGTGQGHSVKQVIDVAQKVTQKNIPIIEGERRPGDPAILVADPTRAIHELGWVPNYSSLEKIIEDAWR